MPDLITKQFGIPPLSVKLLQFEKKEEKKHRI